MKSKFNRLIYGSWVSTILFLLLGIFLLIKPELANSLIGYCVGTIVALSGIMSLVTYFKNKTNFKYMNIQLVYGILTLIAGVAIIINPLSVSKLIIICLGIWMVINGIIKINTALMLKNNKEETWSLILVIAILTILCGSMLIFNPFSGTMVVTQVIGVFVIIYSILDAMQWILIKKRSKEIIKFIK